MCRWQFRNRPRLLDHLQYRAPRCAAHCLAGAVPAADLGLVAGWDEADRALWRQARTSGVSPLTGLPALPPEAGSEEGEEEPGEGTGPA